MSGRRVLGDRVRILVLAAILSCTGCTYLQNRGNDAVDFVDAGVTVSEESHYAVYFGFFNIMPIGYANFDGHLHGLVRRQGGDHVARHHAWGALLYGSEQLGYDDAIAAKPDSPTPWHIGVVGLIAGPRPPVRQTVNCPKLVHLGRYGIFVNCHFPELGDFLLGWFGIDYMDDDTAGKPAAPAVVAPAPGTTPAT